MEKRPQEAEEIDGFLGNGRMLSRSPKTHRFLHTFYVGLEVMLGPGVNLGVGSLGFRGDESLKP